MSLKKYEAFVRTVELGSLTRAAQALGSTQSRISHILSDLEAEYGFALLQRSRGGIRLTDSGARILPRMQAVLEADRELEALVEDIRQADAGTIRLGAFTSVSVHWLPGMIESFQKTHPKAELKMFSGDYHDIEQWLEKGEIEVGFVRLPAPDFCRTIPLTEDPLVVILPRGHRLAGREAVPLKELENEPFISLLQSSAQDIRRTLEQGGIRPNIRFTTKDDYAILAMVEQGLGISIVPQLLLKGSRAQLEVRPLLPGASRTIALAVAQGETPPAVEAFIATVTQWLAQNPQAILP